MSHTTHRIRTAAAATGIICLLVYLRALSCGFVSMDDPDYVLNNAAIRHLDANLLVSAFTGATAGFWMPLTWLSLAVDYRIWGLNPVGYHLTNIFLHALNAGLVVLIAHRLCRDRFGEEPEGRPYLYPGMLVLAGLLFGIHPLRVESVAWVTERKDVLNGLFSLGSILCYLRYAQEKEAAGGGRHPRRWYFGSLVLFGLSLMAKSVSVVLPVMFLVADWYPLGRLQRGRFGALLAEKFPFLCLSAAMAVATLFFTAQSRFLVSYDDFPLGQRLLVSGNAVYEYIRLLFLPTGIGPLHVIPDPIPTSYAVTTALVAIAFVGVGIAGARGHRSVPAVWLAFLLPLLPVLAFFQNGDQSYASRFTYLPSVAPAIAVAVLVASVAAKGRGVMLRRGVSALAAVVLLFHAGLTYRLTGVWHDSGTVWSRAIDLEPQAILFKERGIYYHGAGRYDAAVADYTEALERATAGLQPYIYNLYAYRGEALRAAGRYAEAVEDLSKAIALYPHPEYYHFRGLALKELGRMQEAAADAARAGEATGPLSWYWERHEQEQ